MSDRSNDTEQGRTGWLRAAVLGANDGIVSTASLVLGVAAAHGNHGAIYGCGTCRTGGRCDVDGGRGVCVGALPGRQRGGRSSRANARSFERTSNT